MAPRKRSEENNTSEIQNPVVNAEEFTSIPTESIDFYQGEIERYQETIDRDLDESFLRYGFSLYHSLPPEKLVVLNQKLGFFKGDAIDKYNLAGLEILEENYAKAAEILEESLKEEPELADAIYNLALCYEKMDRKNDALPLWQQYQELIEDEEEQDAIENHIAEITA